MAWSGNRRGPPARPRGDLNAGGEGTNEPRLPGALLGRGSVQARTAARPGGRRGRPRRPAPRGVPCSTMLPGSSTTMRSALCTVARRWAMTSVVRPRISRSSAAAPAARSRRRARWSPRRAAAAAGRAGCARAMASALALAAREPHAALAEEGVEALGQRVDEVERRSRLGGGARPRRRSPRAGRSGCLPRAGREDHRLLRHERDARRRSAGRGRGRSSRRAGCGPSPGRRSAAAAGRRWSCRRRTGRPAPPSRRVATSRSRWSSAGRSGRDGIAEAHVLEAHGAAAPAGSAERRGRRR